MYRKVHDKLLVAVAPAHSQQLIAENTPLEDMCEYLAYTLHSQSSLRQVGIVHYQHCWKMALRIVFPYGHGFDQMTDDAPDDVAPVYIVFGHERIEDVLLAPEQLRDGRFGIMGKTRYGQKQKNQDNLEKLKVGKLTVTTLSTSEVFVRNLHPLQDGHKLGKCRIDSFSCEKIADFRWDHCKFAHGFE